MDTDVAEGGMCAWMAAVRASMANDPCRQLFEDQVQSHAFVFLDDYLDHILARPKQGPIIELVKTPGRRKNVPRRTRATTVAAAKVKNTSLFSLDADSSTKHCIPVNSFHKALLQTKKTSTQGAVDLRKPSISPSSTSSGSIEQIDGRSESVQVADTPVISASVEPEPQASSMPAECCLRDRPVERGSELSVIAEGDESFERNHANIPATHSEQELLLPVPVLHHEAEEYPATEINICVHDRLQGDASQDTRYPVTSLVNTYRSIPLGSLQEVQCSETKAGNHTEPLPSRTVIHSPMNNGRDAFTAPLQVVPTSNPHTIAVPLNDASPKSLTHKGGPAGFPMLPAPSPLRKSMRITPETFTGSALPSTAPVLLPLGKRTSWLVKAREAKAKEGTNSLPGSSVTAISVANPPVLTAMKRKSEEMLDAVLPGAEAEKDHRKTKVAKSTEIGTPPSIPKEAEKLDDDLPLQGEPDASVVNFAEKGFIDLFKRTVEGLGARAGKSTGKSVGDAAAAALAEARAAAEAKVAKRNKVNGEPGDSEIHHDSGLHDQELFGAHARLDGPSTFAPTPQAEGSERRLSLSDLAPETLRPDEPEFLTRTATVTVEGTQVRSNNESVSMTPPNSPPLKGATDFIKPAGPVFNKPPPPPVFMRPVPKQPSIISGHCKEISSNYPSGQYTLPVALSLGIPARLTSPSDGFPPRVQGAIHLSAQPSQSSIFSDANRDKREGVPTWTSHTKDVRYADDSQPRDVRSATTVVDDDDDDDSWPLEEKLAAAEPGWRPFDFSNVDREDTWSSLPTESQGPTRSLTVEKNCDTVPLHNETGVEIGINNEEVRREQEVVEISDAECSSMDVSELDDAAGPAQPSLGHVEPNATGTSRASMTSAASLSQSQVGFFSQATKLVNSMLGGKKAKPELKSLQLAAAAAKKQQEDVDKKMQRLKEMEARRQIVIAKKAEEERARLIEEEKRGKEELEKRKREREENTDRRQPRPPVSTKRTEDDTFKKRRFGPETEKRLESKKHPSKDKKDLVPPVKSAATPSTKTQKGGKATATALVSSATFNTTQNAPPAPSAKPSIPEAKPFKVVTSSLKSKAKAKPQEDDIGDKLPSTMIQSQMAARAKAQMQAANLPTPEVPSESIELPDINSEYSDSEDEERVRTFNPPDWAQSPELRQALQMQSTVNPDDIFGEIRPLRMEEIFRTRQSRFRARTSSANWSGPDGLTAGEIREYERRMGFQRAGG